MKTIHLFTEVHSRSRETFGIDAIQSSDIFKGATDSQNHGSQELYRNCRRCQPAIFLSGTTGAVIAPAAVTTAIVANRPHHGLYLGTRIASLYAGLKQAAAYPSAVLGNVSLEGCHVRCGLVPVDAGINVVNEPISGSTKLFWQAGTYLGCQYTDRLWRLLGFCPGCDGVRLQEDVKDIGHVGFCAARQ